MRTKEYFPPGLTERGKSRGEGGKGARGLRGRAGFTSPLRPLAVAERAPSAPLVHRVRRERAGDELARAVRVDVGRHVVGLLDGFAKSVRGSALAARQGKKLGERLARMEVSA